MKTLPGRRLATEPVRLSGGGYLSATITGRETFKIVSIRRRSASALGSGPLVKFGSGASRIRMWIRGRSAAAMMAGLSASGIASRTSDRPAILPGSCC